MPDLKMSDESMERKIRERRNASPPLPKPAGKPKTKKKVSAGALVSIFLIVAIIAAGVVVYFNISGAGEAVVALLQANLPLDETDIIEGPTAQELEEKEATLNNFEEKLKKKQEKLDSRDSELSALGEELAEREKALKEQQDAFETKSAEVLALAEAQADIKATAAIFEQMDARDAAEVIGNLKSREQIVQLLKAMNEEKAAKILSRIEPEKATKILADMMM